MGRGRSARFTRRASALPEDGDSRRIGFEVGPFIGDGETRTESLCAITSPPPKARKSSRHQLQPSRLDGPVRGTEDHPGARAISRRGWNVLKSLGQEGTRC